mgnify:CR=1 FL=1|jgi:hypothetical protein
MPIIKTNPIIIYRLSADDKHYYGSTTLPLIQRVQIHTRDNNCYAYKAGISCSKNLTWEVVEEVTDENRYEREMYYIQNFPCVNKVGKVCKYSMTPEQKEKHKQYMLEYRKRPDIIARENKRAFDKREQRKAEELQTGIGIKIKKGVIIERDMNDNLPKIISQDEDAYTPLYTPFGINSPEKNALYEQHKDYVEGKINELSYKTQNQVYYCEECEVQVARATTVVLRRHFSTFKHLKNAGILTSADKPFKKRKPYNLKRNRGVINPVLVQSFHESVEEGATL